MPKVPVAYRQARSAEILAAAAGCFGRSGYRGTSMADIADQTGLSVGALYRYYESKEVLFQALTRAAREANAALWLKAGEAGAPSAQLRSFVSGFLDAVIDPECRHGLALDIRLRSEALDSELVRRELQASYRLQIDNMTRLLRGAGGGRARSRTAEARARALIGLLNEAATQALLVPGFDVKSFRREIRALVDAWTEEN